MATNNEDGLNPGQQGTVFPGLDGTPGDRDGGADITGQVLPPLTPEYEDAAGTGSNVSIVPGGPEPAGDAPTVAGGQIEAPTGRRARSAQDRIAQLTKQYRQEQRARGDIEGQLSEALSILRAQGEQLNELRAGRAPAPRQAANEAADALGLGSTPSETGGQSITLDSIDRLLQSRFSDYEARAQQRNTEIEQMRQSHEAAFKEASEEMPELLDNRSAARRVFDQLYAVSPLRTLPDGPYQIALQVQGILAAESRGGGQNPQRKLQAGVVAPAAGPTDIPDSQRANARKEFEKLTQLRRGGNEDFQVYKKWRQLRDNLQRPRR
jgi:hypothetical protein